MKSVVVREKSLTRQQLADPHSDMTHMERLIKSNAVDMRENYTIKVSNSGYWSIKPIDNTKLFK